METKEIAQLFAKGYDCSQVVLAECADITGMSKETANKVSACFGGGMAKGETCGAVAGALMAIGMKYGFHDDGKPEQKEIMAKKREEFYEKFSEKYPSCICRELLGYDLTKPEEMQKILDEGLLFEFCPKVVGDIIEILRAEIL